MTRRIGIVILAVLVSVMVVAGIAAAQDVVYNSLPTSAIRSMEAALVTPEAQKTAVRQSVFWLIRTHQNDDGGYASFSSGANNDPSSVGGTADAILAIASAGYSADLPFPGKGSSPIDYLEANVSEVETFANTDGAQAGKLILALTAAGQDPEDFGGINVVNALQDQLQPDGSYNVSDVFKQSLAVLALASADEPVPAKATNWIVDAQADNGSWDDGFGTTDNPDATSMAVMALLAAGTPETDPVVTAARDFLADVQLPDAGWEYGTGFGSSANTTALVIQALSAVGEDWYDEAGVWAKGGTNPLEALLSFQSSSGAFQTDFGQGPFDDFFTTVQAIPAVSGHPLPLPARFEASQRALMCLETMQDPATGGWEQFVGTGPNAAGTARAIEAIRAAGSNPQSARWTTGGGVNAVEFLETSTPEYVDGGMGGRSGVVTQGVVAAGGPYTPDAFAGLDLPERIDSFLTPSGEYDSTAFGIAAQAEAMLGLLVSGNPVAPSAIDFVLNAQQAGDWGDADQNGLAVNVLGRSGARLPAGAIEHLHQSQLDSAGWGFFPDMNPSSTSEVVQGLVEIGENPFGPSWSKVIDGRLTSPVEAVMATQDANGCWPNMFGPGDDPFSTTDAILVLNVEPSWDVWFAHAPVVSGGSQ